jgi:hypothetical protein
MKAISFSAVEILPALLDHSKTQTIRPAWKECKMCGVYLDQCPHGRVTSQFKIGDLVQLMWKQRTSPKDSYFCTTCGSIVKGGYYTCSCKFDIYRPFPKILGTVKLTEIFTIEMWKGNDVPLVSGYTLKESEELAKRDGFKIYKEFFEYFAGRRYDWLEKPKTFEVRRWDWIEV